jgi:hypothetical protein
MVCLVWATSALADEKSDFEKARVAYVKKDYIEAAARFEAMLDPKTGTLKTKELITEAEFCLGAAKFAQNKKDEAHKLWEKVIRETQGQYQADVLTYPTDVLNDFIDEKDRLKKEIEQLQSQQAQAAEAARVRAAAEKARLEARVAELEALVSQETVVVQNSRWASLLPFGIGQFQNNQNFLGGLFLASEAAAVAATCVLFFPYRYYIDQYNAAISGPGSANYRQSLANQSALVAQDIRTADFILLGALGAVALTGIIQAQIAYKPIVTFTRSRKTTAIWPSLSPLPSGAQIGLQGRF